MTSLKVRGLTHKERVLTESWDQMLCPFLGQLTAMMALSLIVGAVFPDAVLAADDEVNWETGDTSALQQKGNTMVKVLKVLAVLVLTGAGIWAAVEHSVGDERQSKNHLVKVAVSFMAVLIVVAVVNYFLGSFGGIKF